MEDLTLKNIEWPRPNIAKFSYQNNLYFYLELDGPLDYEKFTLENAYSMFLLISDKTTLVLNDNTSYEIVEVHEEIKQKSPLSFSASFLETSG